MTIDGAEEPVTTVTVAGSTAFFANRDGLPAGMNDEQIARTAARFIAASLATPVAVLYATQVHGALTYTYGREGELAPGPHLVGRCDALVTAEEHVALLVRTADCLPVTLAGPGVAAIVHAGWRGLAADVLGATVRRIAAEFAVPSLELEAVLGVGVGPCHYEVGDDVVSALRGVPSFAVSWDLGGRVDLRAWAVGRLTALGVPERSITALPGCTACAARYHSHRRDGGGAGRQWSAIVRRGA
jgi:purine-nucleoside/S-methyl-5'-thioadenosine phosphorylase / adenosine deaminase